MAQIDKENTKMQNAAPFDPNGALSTGENASTQSVGGLQAIGSILSKNSKIYLNKGGKPKLILKGQEGVSTSDAKKTNLDNYSGYLNAGTSAIQSLDTSDKSKIQNSDAQRAEAAQGLVKDNAGKFGFIGSVVGLGVSALDAGIQKWGPKLTETKQNTEITGSGGFGGVYNKKLAGDISSYNESGLAGKNAVTMNYLNSGQKAKAVFGFLTASPWIKSELDSAARAKMNEERNKELEMAGKAASIVAENKKLMTAGASGIGNVAVNEKMRLAGVTPGKTAVGKNGLVISKDLHNTAKRIVSSRRAGGILSFAKGGAMNIIPDGALHKENHDIEVETEITKKGIPVVVKEDGGEISQICEIERHEIILHLDLTKKLEELAKIGDDESMIEAGKILAEEIVKNTKDSKDKLLKTIE